jgi:hypothetical protein
MFLQVNCTLAAETPLNNTVELGYNVMKGTE